MTTPRRSGRPDHGSGRWGGVGIFPGPHGDRGAAAVELAIVLPVLLMIIFGIIDFGRAYNQRLILTEAAREGARAEAVGANASQQVTNVVNNRFVPTVSVTPCPTGAAPTPPSATVNLTATFKPITPLGKTLSWNVMTARGVMTCVG
ncbi:TadE family protein [Dactylosporangium sp. CS-047395]|uniref:TadE family protein n=1 Tax=Dactylosporangium sp. CS-047395 TaxID=3239936 RepID=UPI003D8D06E0